MTRKNIFLDLDNVLVVSNFVDLASKEAGHDLKEEDITTWDFANFPENVRQLIFKYFNNPTVMCDTVKVVEGTVDWIKKYKSENDIYIITARNEQIAPDTLVMLDRIYDLKNIKKVIFERDKVKIMKDFNDVLFVDDSPHNIMSAQEAGIYSVMISNKYTKYNHYMRDKVRWEKVLTDIKL